VVFEASVFENEIVREPTLNAKPATLDDLLLGQH
jgi:hypothetical protein